MASPGVYVFKRSGRVAYVGRGDTDVEARARESYRQGNYDRRSTLYRTSSPRQAYLLECRLYHRHHPIDNQIHPRVPDGTNWRCPVSGCPWS